MLAQVVVGAVRVRKRDNVLGDLEPGTDRRLHLGERALQVAHLDHPHLTAADGVDHRLLDRGLAEGADVGAGVAVGRPSKSLQVDACDRPIAEMRAEDRLARRLVRREDEHGPVEPSRAA